MDWRNNFYRVLARIEGVLVYKCRTFRNWGNELEALATTTVSIAISDNSV